MTVPFLDLAAQHALLADELTSVLRRVLVSGRYVLGPETAAFERELATHLGAEAAVAVSSGTDALIVAMMSLGIGPGDRVITSPYSFISTATAIRRVGAWPVFADIEPDSFNLDADAVGRWFEDHPAAAHTVKAILPVHLYGQCADLDRLLAVVGPRGLPIIEDVAQSIDATLPATADEPRYAGTVGRFGCISFYPSKNLGAMGEAGLIVTADRADADHARRLRNQGTDQDGTHRWIGGNFRMDEMQAALLRVKLRHLRTWTTRRRTLAGRYHRGLSDLPALGLPKAMWGSGHHTYHQYVVRVATGRDRLRTNLARRGIETRVYYARPLHHEPCLQDLAISADALPHARAAAEACLALPMNPFLTDADQDRVIEAIRDEVAT